MTRSSRLTQSPLSHGQHNHAICTLEPATEGCQPQLLIGSALPTKAYLDKVLFGAEIGFHHYCAVTSRPIIGFSVLAVEHRMDGCIVHMREL